MRVKQVNTFSGNPCNMDVDPANNEPTLFRRSYPLHTRLRLISQTIGPNSSRSGLCIGTVSAAFRARLAMLGGEWTFTQQTYSPLPYADGAFDCVLVLDHLEWVDDDYAFMADIHRVLKSAGTLFVDTEHYKRWTVWRPIRRLFGVEERTAERIRNGYTDGGLFDILKDGFDLQESRTYSRFFVEGTETMLRLAVGAWCGGERSDGAEQEGAEPDDWSLRRIDRMQTIAFPFFLLAEKLDWLLFFTRGYRVRAVARRRLWKPRRAPIMRDGRTLVDATLNTRIGTAAPF